MTTTTDQDEELLIISDDWDDVIEMDIDLNEEASDDSEVISFDEEITIDDTLEIKAEETTQTNKLDLGGLSIESDKSEELDLDFDLGWEDSEMTVEKMLWDKEDIILEKSEDNNSSESTEDLFDFGPEEETLDINAILNATIAKLNARKEKIESVKEETIESIAKLNEEIKGLQSEVKTHKGEVKEFDKETKKIDENVSELEKMKMK